MTTIRLGAPILRRNVARHPEVAHRQQGPSVRSEFARSKNKAMDAEIARNQNYDDHDADDGKDVHSALLPYYDMITPEALALQK